MSQSHRVQQQSASALDRDTAGAKKKFHRDRARTHAGKKSLLCDQEVLAHDTMRSSARNRKTGRARQCCVRDPGNLSRQRFLCRNKDFSIVTDWSST